MFYNKVNNLCKQRDTTITRMCKEIGLSNAVATGWSKGATPKLGTVRLIADYFGVSVDDLLSEDSSRILIASDRSTILQGNTGTTTVAQGSANPAGDQLTEMEKELLRIFRSLDMRKKNEFMSKAYDIEDSIKKEV